MIAGDTTDSIPARPQFAAANDAAFDHGIVAQGHMNGEINTERKIPWL
jgi:hypothetical protein